MAVWDSVYESEGSFEANEEYASVPRREVGSAGRESDSSAESMASLCLSVGCIDTKMTRLGSAWLQVLVPSKC